MNKQFIPLKKAQVYIQSLSACGSFLFEIKGLYIYSFTPHGREQSISHKESHYTFDNKLGVYCYKIYFDTAFAYPA